MKCELIMSRVLVRLCQKSRFTIWNSLQWQHFGKYQTWICNINCIQMILRCNKCINELELWILWTDFEWGYSLILLEIHLYPLCWFFARNQGYKCFNLLLNSQWNRSDIQRGRSPSSIALAENWQYLISHHIAYTISSFFISTKALSFWFHGGTYLFDIATTLLNIALCRGLSILTMFYRISCDCLPTKDTAYPVRYINNK